MKNQGKFQLLKFAVTALLLCTVATLIIVRPFRVASASICPTTCGFYTISGLGASKQAILNNGGNTLDMAVAMLETDTMQASSYAYGDNKTYDSANFGIFKQNWYMLRMSIPQYESYRSNNYNTGATLNSNLSWDISCLHTSQNHYGRDIWFAGHRNGQSGLSNPNTTDINNYKNGVYWIQSQIDSGHQTDDTRFWANIPAI
jgi:hypothetical protein